MQGGKVIVEVEKDMVNHPKHYNRGSIEAIEVIEDWKLYFSVGSAVKYIARLGAKDLEIQELKKTRWYLERVCSNGIGANIETNTKYSPDTVAKDWGLNETLRQVLLLIYWEDFKTAILVLDEEIERRVK